MKSAPPSTAVTPARRARARRRRPLADLLASVLAQRPAGLICDFDGTLSAIVSRPEQARVLPAARTALEALSRRLALVAIVSGRPAEEVRSLVNLPGLVYAGNHGLERLRDDTIELQPEAGGAAREVDAAAAALRRQLSSGDGVWLESKGLTLSIHYRQARAGAAAGRRQALRLAREAAGEGLEITEGKKVVELRPRDWPGKGRAVRGLVEEFGLRGVVYAGDDHSDAAVFRELRAFPASTCAVAVVAVGGPEAPPALAAAADATVPGPEAFARALLAVATG